MNRNLSHTNTSLRYDLVMIAITAIWGTTFVVGKNLVEAMSPLTYLSTRFTIAALILSLCSFRSWKKIDLETIKGGLILGLLVFGGFVTQSTGLIYTTPSKSAFVTGVSVILVPFFGFLVAKTAITKEHILAVVLAACGFGLLTLPDNNESLNLGDVITVTGTAFWALHIVYTGVWARRTEAAPLLIVQLIIAAFLFSTSLFLLKWLNLLPLLTQNPTDILKLDWSSLTQLIYLAGFATVITIFIQTRTQKHISATRAAIIFSLEPAFAAIFSYFVFDESLSWKAGIGGLLIIGGIITSELKLFETSADDLLERSFSA